MVKQTNRFIPDLEPLADIIQELESELVQRAITYKKLIEQNKLTYEKAVAQYIPLTVCIRFLRAISKKESLLLEDTKNISLLEILRELRREEAMRFSVYSKKVESGYMKIAEMTKRIKRVQSAIVIVRDCAAQYPVNMSLFN